MWSLELSQICRRDKIPAWKISFVFVLIPLYSSTFHHPNRVRSEHQLTTLQAKLRSATTTLQQEKEVQASRQASFDQLAAQVSALKAEKSSLLAQVATATAATAAAQAAVQAANERADAAQCAADAANAQAAAAHSAALAAATKVGNCLFLCDICGYFLLFLQFFLLV